MVVTYAGADPKGQPRRGIESYLFSVRAGFQRAPALYKLKTIFQPLQVFAILAFEIIRINKLDHHNQ